MPSIVPVTRHGISSPDDLHVSQFGWSAVSPSWPAISLSAGHRGGQGKRAAARSHAQPHLCGEHGEHRRALDLEGRGDQRNASSGWVHRNFRFRFPQSLRHVGKRKREAIKKRDCNSIHFRDPAHQGGANIFITIDRTLRLGRPTADLGTAGHCLVFLSMMSRTETWRVTGGITVQRLPAGAAILSDTAGAAKICREAENFSVACAMVSLGLEWQYLSSHSETN